MFMVSAHGFRSKGPSHTITNNTFIFDSGATCHMCGLLEGMFDIKPFITDIMEGSNEVKAIVSIIQYKGIVLLNDGTSVDITLQVNMYIPKLKVNLFSMPKANENTGGAISSKCQIIPLTDGNSEIYFIKLLIKVQDASFGLKLIPLPITLPSQLNSGRT
jgi:hypothetical protein